MYLRSFKRFILISLALFGLSVSNANAALVTQMLGLDIGGTSYDVTFHSGSSFYTLWDGDQNNVFGSDGSLFDSAPLFWGDGLGAAAASSAIIMALGTIDTTSAGSDAFFIPNNLVIVPIGDFSILTILFTCTDIQTAPGVDVGDCTIPMNPASIRTYASFSRSALPAVPVPAAVWLFGSALIGLVGFCKRKSRIAA